MAGTGLGPNRSGGLTLWQMSAFIRSGHSRPGTAKGGKHDNRLYDTTSESLVIRVDTYVDTKNYNGYLKMAEDLNFRILEIIRDCGSDLYSPISNIYSSTADRFDENLISKSKELTESWKSGKEWPFPEQTQESKR